MSRWTGLKIYTKLIYQQLETLQVGKFQVEFWRINLGQENDDDAYGNTDCGVFKLGRFLPKNQHIDCCSKFATGLKCSNRHRSKSIWVTSLFFCQNDSLIRGIILAKEQTGHSYTFWSMSIWTF